MANLKDQSDLPWVYAVVPVFNRCDKTLNFLREWEKIDYPNKKVVICDDASVDNTYQNIKLNFPNVDVLRGDGNLWWAGGTNAATIHALAQGAEYILTINDDCMMAPDFLTEMVRIAMQNPKYIVGCRLMRQDLPDQIWSIGTSTVFSRYSIFALNYEQRRWTDVCNEVPNPLPVDTLAGNGVLFPREVFDKLGLYDEHTMPQYHADSDMVLRAVRAGYKPVVAVNSVIYNEILTEPLVTNRKSLIFSKKSDRYWKANWAILWRYEPFGWRTYLMVMQYVPFFVPRWIVRTVRWFQGLLKPRQSGKMQSGAARG